MTRQAQFEDHHSVEQDAGWSEHERIFRNRLMENLELVRINHYDKKDMPIIADWVIKESRRANRELIDDFEKMAYIIDIDWVISDKDWQFLKNKVRKA